MAAGDMTDGEGHGQNRQAEGQGHADETDTQSRKGGGQHSRTASAQHQPGRSDEFRGKLASHDPPFPCYVLEPYARHPRESPPAPWTMVLWTLLEFLAFRSGL